MSDQVTDTTFAPGDTVVPNRVGGGPPLGPPMVICEITLHGSDASGAVDLVAWWRSEDGKLQIIEIDSRCVTLVCRGGGPR